MEDIFYRLIGIEITLFELSAILFVHFVADFMAQTDYMAKGKSSSNRVLGLHILIYSIFLIPFGVAYAIVNGALHFVTDYISSRASKRQWEKGDTHNFFVIVGFDQFIHVICLVWTYQFLSWFAS